MCHVARHRKHLNLRFGGFLVFFVLWLVVAGGIKGEVAEEFSGVGVDDADVEVVDEHDDVGSGVGSPDPGAVIGVHHTLRTVTAPVCQEVF